MQKCRQKRYKASVHFPLVVAELLPYGQFLQLGENL